MNEITQEQLGNLDLSNPYTQVRLLVRSAYQLQRLRIQAGNRIVMAYYVSMGLGAGKKLSDLTDEDLEVLVEMKIEYDRITDAIVGKRKALSFEGCRIITSPTYYYLFQEYVSLESQEKKTFKNIEGILEGVPVYAQYLKGIKGIGPAIAGVLISEIDIRKSKYASSLWMYAGYDTAPDGKGRSRNKEHLVERKYIDKFKNEQTRLSITFNPLLKTKLYLLATIWIKLGDKTPYSKVYYDYKNRLENHPKHQEKTKLHRHRMALRYMIKRFLVDLYANWRRIEGLEVFPEYSEAKLGFTHGRQG